MWSRRFPHNTPQTKEAYYYRTIFEEFYPQPSAASTVPGGPSIACRYTNTPRHDNKNTCIHKHEKRKTACECVNKNMRR